MKDSDPILLVEDNKIDIKNFQRACNRFGINNPVLITRHGEDALAFLHRDVPYQGAPRPALILLDLNMPVMNGLELISVVKAEPELRSIPIVVITTSKEPRDREECYRLGVSGYITKPIEFSEFVQAVGTIYNYWKLCELPD
ncbi:MAG: response regulator [Acidobacteriota bacterium]|nr:response regulator [Acidobacteriota bacterium]